MGPAELAYLPRPGLLFDSREHFVILFTVKGQLSVLSNNAIAQCLAFYKQRLPALIKIWLEMFNIKNFIAEKVQHKRKVNKIDVSILLSDVYLPFSLINVR